MLKQLTDTFQGQVANLNRTWNQITELTDAIAVHNAAIEQAEKEDRECNVTIRSHFTHIDLEVPAVKVCDIIVEQRVKLIKEFVKQYQRMHKATLALKIPALPEYTDEHLIKAIYAELNSEEVRQPVQVK